MLEIMLLELCKCMNNYSYCWLTVASRRLYILIMDAQIDARLRSLFPVKLTSGCNK